MKTFSIRVYPLGLFAGFLLGVYVTVQMLSPSKHADPMRD